MLSGALASPLLASACTTLAQGAATPQDPFSEAAILTHLQALDAQPHLRSGSLGDLAILVRTQDLLENAGFTTQQKRVDSPFFEARRSVVRLGDTEIEVFPQHPVITTGSQGLTAPLRLWQDTRDTAALRDAIGVVMLPHRRHSRLLDPPSRGPLDAALAGRPRALILITQGPSGETLILNAPADSKPYARIPLCVLGPVPGRDLIAAAREGASATLILDGETGTRPGANLIATLTRPDPAAPLLVVSTPRTAWTPALAERGPGYASFLAFAAWAPRALPRHNLLFLSTTAHEYDNAGGLAFLTGPDAPDPARLALWVHFGAGFAGRAHHDLGGGRLLPLPAVDDQRYLMGSDALLPVLRKAFAGQPGLEQPYPASAGAVGELQEIFSHGYSPAFGLFGGHLRHHAMTDRLSMTDPVWIRAAALSARQVVESALRDSI
jgi:hypothetical protein